MNIKSEYIDTLNNSRSFYHKIGMQRTDFDLLLLGFILDIPKSLSKEERLFAILYAEKHHIDAKDVGELLEYSKANCKKYGQIFLNKATIALTNARTAPPQPTLPPDMQSTLLFLTMKSPKKGRNNKTEYEDNVTISLKMEEGSNPLEENRIVEHAQRRIDLFFYLLIAYYKTGLKVDIAETITQHGMGTKKDNTNGCHSALLTSLLDAECAKPSHLYDTRQKPDAMICRSGLLDNTHFYNSLNSTVELHKAVNYFETHHLEGKKTDNKMRKKSLIFLNEVSQGAITPITGMLKFLVSLKEHFDERESLYLSNMELPTSPIASRSLILNSEKKGSFKETWHENIGYEPTLNDDYVNTILMPTEADKDRLKKQSDESSEAYIERFSIDQNHIYEGCYARIKQDMNIPLKKEVRVSRQGMFAESGRQSSNGSMNNEHENLTLKKAPVG